MSLSLLSLSGNWERIIAEVAAVGGGNHRTADTVITSNMIVTALEFTRRSQRRQY